MIEGSFERACVCLLVLTTERLARPQNSVGEKHGQEKRDERDDEQDNPSAPPALFFFPVARPIQRARRSVRN